MKKKLSNLLKVLLKSKTSTCSNVIKGFFFPHAAVGREVVIWREMEQFADFSSQYSHFLLLMYIFRLFPLLSSLAHDSEFFFLPSFTFQDKSPESSGGLNLITRHVFLGFFFKGYSFSPFLPLLVQAIV